CGDHQRRNSRNRRSHRSRWTSGERSSSHRRPRSRPLGDVTLLPGFIDAHTHIIGRTLGDPLNDLAVVKDYASYGAIVGVANARATLMAGFTSIRVVGTRNFEDMALRQAITDGRVTGQR